MARCATGQIWPPASALRVALALAGLSQCSFLRSVMCGIPVIQDEVKLAVIPFGKVSRALDGRNPGLLLTSIGEDTGTGQWHTGHEVSTQPCREGLRLRK